MYIYAIYTYIMYVYIHYIYIQYVCVGVYKLAMIRILFSQKLSNMLFAVIMRLPPNTECLNF